MSVPVKFFRFVLEYHLFVAVCTLALWWSTSLVFSINPFRPAEAIMLFSGTVCYYNLHKLAYTVHGLNPIKWMVQIRTALLRPIDLLSIVIPALFFTASLFYYFPLLNIYFLIALILPLLYSFPVFIRKGTPVRLREVPMFKIMTIAAGYTLLTVYFPIWNELKKLTPSIHCYAAGYFILIASLCIPFEIRDEKKERLRNVPTLLSHGLKKVKVISLSSIAIAMICSLCCWFLNVFPANVSLAFVFVYLISGVWILRARSDWPNWYFKFGVDGTMILFSIFLILFKLWH